VNDFGKDVMVHEVTQEDVKNWNIKDVVLPLPGYDVKYPQNSISQIYKDLIAQDGIDPTAMHKNKDLNLPGGYRKLIEIPGNLKWNIVTYDTFDQCLVTTDLDILKKNPPPQIQKTGQFRGLTLSFDLSTSSYATMFFRQIMRTQTSQKFHKQLADEIQEKYKKSHE